MKSKIPVKDGKKQNKKAATKVRKYEAHYLALALVSVLLLEGIMISWTSKAEWSKGTEILDMSTSLGETKADIAVFLQPVTDAVQAVNQFYVDAATQMTPMLDMSDEADSVAILVGGVNEFYQQAATQMAQLLDVSSISSWPIKLAGASTK